MRENRTNGLGAERMMGRFELSVQMDLTYVCMELGTRQGFILHDQQDPYIPPGVTAARQTSTFG